MHLSDDVETTPHLANATRGPLAQLYKNVLLQVQKTKHHRSFGKLWSRVAPSANIYRHLGIAQERLRHCLDLNEQLEDLANDERYMHLLGGENATSEIRCEALKNALKQTRTDGLVFGVESQQVPEGFLPLEEFLDKDVTCTLGIIHPEDPDERGAWAFNVFLALVVFTIQTLAPAVMIYQLWNDKDNHIKDMKTLWNMLSVKELLCMGKDNIEILTTVIGTLFVVMLYTMVHQHVADEHDDAKKMGRLPGDNFWLLLGNLSQSLCPLMILVAAPLEYWQEDGVTGIMMNSMAMLFVWTLDDLAGDVFGYIGEDDKDFQKQAAWNYALLAYCPVYLPDVVNLKPTCLEDFWKIKYNASGNLLDKSDNICETRIMDTRLIKSETTPLNQDTDEDNCLEETVVKYMVTPHSPKRYLPGGRENIIVGIWFLTKHLVTVMCVIPAIWFVCNKPCYSK